MLGLPYADLHYPNPLNIDPIAFSLELIEGYKF